MTATTATAAKCGLPSARGPILKWVIQWFGGAVVHQGAIIPRYASERQAAGRQAEQKINQAYGFDTAAPDRKSEMRKMPRGTSIAVCFELAVPFPLPECALRDQP